MDGMKTWYQSKTVWGALIAVAASIAQVAGVDLAPDVQDDMADLAIALGGALGGALSIYGRISASTAIGRR
ncbi:conserved exported protein of unknown function [Pseudorhizobium banfieldiae]|uniref:Holin n=1 Tax=Pseudorhizobium banfieldiae TaxID=1125847 RepID=L0NEB0_9HYPH|nr:hypothetical protein [Pseudorhizobium banfieldiae]CAD6603178.1 hypothetical protein RNT25_01306 [arsenite-oxidising bacterium NT-25]CAD6609084.1 hypothetical protein RTCK_02149 [Rhizobium sp. TCK]CCF18637.1 conserved exported protein of unknown function [Pseudorhizobium banfieldiae]